MIARENIKWIIIFVLIIFFSLFGGVIALDYLEYSKYNYFYIAIRNKTNSDIQIFIENKKNIVTINVNKNNSVFDYFYLNERKWKTNGEWTFKFTISADNNIFYQEIMSQEAHRIGSYCAYGGLQTFILIEDKENEYFVTFNDFIPEDYYR